MRAWIVLPGGRVKRFRNRQTRCRCGRRQKGRPRVGYGMCHGQGERTTRALRRDFRAELSGVERDARDWDEVGRAAPRFYGH